MAPKMKLGGGGGGRGGTGKLRGELNIDRGKHVLNYGVF